MAKYQAVSFLVNFDIMSISLIEIQCKIPHKFCILN